MLSLLYGPTFTSIHDYWKNHGFDSTDLCRLSDVSVSLMCYLGLSYFSFKEQASFKMHLIICDRVYLFIIFLVFILAVQTLHSLGQAFSNCDAGALLLHGMGESWFPNQGPNSHPLCWKADS